MLLTTYIVWPTSMLKMTPPKGVPKAKVIPEAAAAASILFLIEVEFEIFENCLIFNNLLHIIVERWTYGPTLPVEAPAVIAEKIPITLAMKASNEKYLYILIPDKTVFTSGIPDPSASAEMKYPTLVATSISNTQEMTQKIK